MWKWTVVLGVLLLLQLTTAKPKKNQRISTRHEILEDLPGFFKIFVDDVRELAKTILEDPKNVADYAKDLTSYRSFLEKTADYENMNFTAWAPYAFEARQLIPFGMTYDDKTDYENKYFGEAFVTQNYAKFVNTSDKISLKIFKYADKFTQGMRNYIYELTPEERKNKLEIIYWYDVWVHEHNFQLKMSMLGDLYMLKIGADNPKPNIEVFAYKLQKLFLIYVGRMKEIVEKMQTQEFIDEVQHVEELIEQNKFKALTEFMKFYANFDKWLLSKGTSYMQHRNKAYKSTLEFFDKINYYTDLYFENVNVEPQLVEWYDDLKKTETFEDTFKKYFDVYSILN